ncbi:MAG: DUF2946 family protein [Betaproteobacteria bacterium]|nr:DUF2946 family protein [Betaproteobacteria bacterium]
MDPVVLRAMARWPNLPAVYGWLALDRRGNWLLKDSASRGFARIGNAALREFIARNYAADENGCWYFQNGPQRVYVALAYAPLVLHYEAKALVDHCGRATNPGATYIDEEGSVLILGERGLGLLDDRDLAFFAARLGADWQTLPQVASREAAARFGFVSTPSDSLR